MSEKLVNPVTVFRDTNPEAFDLLPSGPIDLLPEAIVMAERADNDERPFYFNGNPETALFPEDICRDVLESPIDANYVAGGDNFDYDKVPS